jgi:Lon protease-like protein
MNEFASHHDSHNPIDGGVIHMPDVLPIFPLQNTVLLPGEILPLHIFEPRYREMIDHAVQGERVIGMVEYAGGRSEEDCRADVEQVGCAGYIAQHERLPDGRYLLWLLGIERFHIQQELEVPTQYRQVKVAYTPADEILEDLNSVQGMRRELRQILPQMAGLDDDMQASFTEQIADASDNQLIALAGQILELSGPRKQQLLETKTLLDRYTKVFEDLYAHLEIQPSLADLGNEVH